MSIKIEGIEGLIVDLDNTLFGIPSDEEEQKRYALAAQRAVNQMLKHAGKSLQYSFDEVARLSLESYRTLGHDVEIFVQKDGLERQTLRNLFYLYAQDTFSDLLFKDSQLIAALSQFSPKKIVVLTNSFSAWAIPVTLDRLALRGVILEKNILAPDNPEIDGHKKSKSEQPIHVARAHLEGIPFNRILMIDDKAGNEKIAKYLGLCTGLVHWGNPVEGDISHIDIQGYNVPDIIRQLALK